MNTARCIRFAMLAIACIAQFSHAQCTDFRLYPSNDPMAADGQVRSMNEVDFGAGPRIVASGYFQHIGGVALQSNAVWNGTSWEPLPAGFISPSAPIRDIAMYDDGTGLRPFATLDAPHNGDHVNGERLMKWTGSSWQPMPGTQQLQSASLTVFQGELFVAGSFELVNGLQTERIASWNGTRWRPFGRQGPGTSLEFPSVSVYDAANAHTIAVTYENTNLPCITWTKTGNTWTRFNASGPSLWMSNGTSVPRLVYDSARQRVLMLGNGAMRIWNSSLSTWEPAPLQGGPGIVQLHYDLSAAYDIVRDRVVVFGGVNSNNGQRSNQTWEFDGTNWAQINTATSPSARQNAEMVYDSVRQRIVLWGGRTNSVLNDTWEYDGTNWVQRTPASGSPPPVNSTRMFYDAIQQRSILVVMHGDASTPSDRCFRWNGTAWTVYVLSDSSREPPRVVYHDPVARRIGAMSTQIWELNLPLAQWNMIPELRGPDVAVESMAVYPTSGTPELHIAGKFNYIGTQLVGSHARFNGSTWTSSPIANSSDPQEHFNSLLEVPSGPLVGFYTGGKRLSRWTGTDWQPVSPAITLEKSIQTMIPFGSGANQSILLGGEISLASFNPPGGGSTQTLTSSTGLYGWNAAGLFSTRGTYNHITAITHTTSALASFPTPDGDRVFVGGYFNKAGENPASNLAIWGDPCTPPSILIQPHFILDSNYDSLETAVLELQAVGTGPLTYQWYKATTPLVNSPNHIEGATSPKLIIENWTISDFGQYSCVVSGPLGTASSNALTFQQPDLVSYQHTVVDVSPLTTASGTFARGNFRTAYFQEPDRVIYDGEVLSAGQNWTSLNSHIWEWTPASRTTLIATPTPTPQIPDATIYAVSLNNVASNSGALFNYSYMNPDFTNTAVGFAHVSPTALTPIAHGNGAALGINGAMLPQNPQLDSKVSSDGNAWFTGRLTTNQQVWWNVTDPSSPVLGPVSGTPTPIPGFTWLTTQSPITNSVMYPGDNQKVAFKAQFAPDSNLNDARSGIWGPNPSSLQLQLATGMTMPGTDLTIQEIREVVRDVDSVWVRVRARDESTQQDTHVVAVVNDDGQFSVLPATGPTLDPNWKMTEILELQSVRNGLAVLWTFVEPTTCPTSCPSQHKPALLLRMHNGDLQPIWIDSYTPLPPLLLGLSVNDLHGTVTKSGVVLLQFNVFYTPDFGGFFAWTPQSGIFHVAAPGTQLPTNPEQTEFATISSASAPTRNALATTPVLSDSGRFAYRAVLSSGGTAVVLADLANTAAFWHPCPIFIEQAFSQSVTTGGDVTFFTRISGQGSLSYQWLQNGLPLANSTLPDGTIVNGATSATLSLSNVSPTAAGTYVCVATNSCGTQQSWDAVLTVGTFCDSIDFNNDTSIFDPIDIDAFLSVYGEGPCIPEDATCNDIDFNNDGSLFDPCDIDTFLSVFSEGPCAPCGQ